MTWGTFKAVRRGLGLIDYYQFKRIVCYVIGCGDDYVAASWSEFDRNRLDYCISRDPEEQGYALINLAYQLNKEKENGDESSKEDQRPG